MKKFLLALVFATAALFGGTPIRVSQESTTATIAGVDDYFLLDGTTFGTRKILAGQFVNNAVSYSDPSWLTALSWAKLTGVPSPVLTATGDATGAATFTLLGSTSIALTLANSGVTAASYGDATHTLQATFDAKGRATLAASVLITPAWSSITGTPTTLAGYGIADGVNATVNDTNLTGSISGHTLTFAWSGTLPNARIANPSVTIAGHVVALGGTQTLAASDLTNGTTGTGSVVLAASPALTGTPTSPTAAVDTNTTQLATTAYVIGQASEVGDGTPAMDGAAARGTSTHFARADHVHPTDTSLVPKTTTVNGHALSANVTVTAGDVGNATAQWNANQINGVAPSGLATGLLKNTAATGVPTIAVSGTDYAPATSGAALLYGNGSGGFSNAVVLTATGLSFAAGNLSLAAIPNTSLANSGVTIGTTSIALGGTSATLAGLNSITSAAGQNLVFALGTGGTALTLTNSTLAATFAGNLTVNGTGTSSFAGALTVANGLTVNSTGSNPLVTISADSSAGYDRRISLVNSQASGKRVDFALTTVAAGNLMNVYNSTDSADQMRFHLGTSSTGWVEIPTTVTATNSTSGSLVVGTNVGLSGSAGGASFFGGAVNVSSTTAQQFSYNRSSGTTDVYGVYSLGGTINSLIGIAGSAGGIVNGSASGDTVIRTASKNFLVTTDDGTTAMLKIAATTGAATFASSVLSSNATAGIGYTTGAGGTVTQGTSRTTGVTLNKVTGTITLFSAVGSASWQTFTFTNSAIATVNDVVHVTQQSGTDKYLISTTTTAVGSCAITFATTGGTTTEAPVFNFVVIKGSAN